jgi:hypothetical protein
MVRWSDGHDTCTYWYFETKPKNDNPFQRESLLNSYVVTELSEAYAPSSTPEFFEEYNLVYLFVCNLVNLHVLYPFWYKYIIRNKWIKRMARGVPLVFFFSLFSTYMLYILVQVPNKWMKPMKWHPKHVLFLQVVIWFFFKKQCIS